MCLPSGPETQEIHFYPIPTEYESAPAQVDEVEQVDEEAWGRIDRFGQSRF